MKSVSGGVSRLVVACRNDAGLRGYQQEMKERLYAMWQGTQHVMCQMPTGTGKTHLMVSVVRDMVRSGMGTVWIVAHRIELIEQISETLQRYGVDHGRVVSGYETTDERVQVASVQTLHRRLEGARTECRIPALIVIDEAHHAVAETYAALWRRFPQAFVLGLTATPCRLNGKGFTGLFERLLTSWTVDRFIDEGLLSGYDYVSILPESEAQRRVDSLTRRGRDGDFSLMEMDRVLNRRESVEQLYRSYHEFAEGKKGIVYAINQAHAKRICAYYSRKGVRIAAIDCRTGAKERRECVERYGRGELDVLVNVDIFTEGFDCPEVEFIQLARPTLSLAKYLQQVGRGLRVQAGKSHVVVLDQVGMYRLFGLPSEPHNWQRLFEGKEHAKREALQQREVMRRRRTATAAETEHEMVVIHRYEEVVRLREEGALPVVTFEEDGCVGLCKGDKVVVPPMYRHIGAFVGAYALAERRDRSWCVLKEDGGVALESCPMGAQLQYEGFVLLPQGTTKGFVDLKNGRRYEALPEVIHLDFLEFVKVDGGLYLRLGEREFGGDVRFDETDMKVVGDVFQHRGIFIHRSQPDRIFRFLRYADDGRRKLLEDSKGAVFVYASGQQPERYGWVRWFQKRNSTHWTYEIHAT